ncbi:MAG: GldL-related protein [Bacteroidia bacterium]
MKTRLNILGFIAALLMISTVVMKSNHFPGAGIAMVLSGFALSIYLPFFFLYKPVELASSEKNRTALIGAISASVINLGINFKFMHWPGAGVMLVLGLTTFALVFIPLLLGKKFRAGISERKLLMNSLGASGVTLFALGILFKIMHWPGASLMLIASVPVLFLGYFLMYMTDPTVDKDMKTRYLRKAFMSVIIGCVVASFVLVALNKPWYPPTPAELAEK